MINSHRLAIADMNSVSAGELFYYEGTNSILGLRVSNPGDPQKYFVKLLENGETCSVTDLSPASEVSVISFGKNYVVQLSDELSDFHLNPEFTVLEYPCIAIGNSGALYLLVRNSGKVIRCIDLANGEHVGQYPKVPYAIINKCEVRIGDVSSVDNILVSFK